MNASELRHIIKFQVPTTTSDGMGGQTATGWTTSKTSRARIVPIGGDITYENGQTRGVKSFNLVTRYSKDFDITHEMRILWGSRILVPNVTVNIDSLEVWMSFEATEKVK